MASLFTQLAELRRRGSGRDSSSPRKAQQSGLIHRERECLVYGVGDRAVNIGIYGRWAPDSEVQFVINGRWNPPRSGPQLSEPEATEIEEAIREYARSNRVSAVISVDRS